MSKKNVVILLLVMAVILAGLLVLAVILEIKQPGDHNNTPETTAGKPVESTTQLTPDPTETTQKQVPGVEDSIFAEDPTEGTAKPTDPEKTEQKPNDTTVPDDTTEPGEAPKPGELSYEAYQAMSGAEQQAYMQSFPSMDAFFAWYNAAKAKYEEENPSIDVGDGSVDVGDIIGGNN